MNTVSFIAPGHQHCQTKMFDRRHTNGTNDGGTTEVLGRHHLGVQLGVPLQLHAVGQVVEGVAGRHFELLNKLIEVG